MKTKHDRPLALITFVQVMGWCAILIVGVPTALGLVGVVRDAVSGGLAEDPWLVVQCLCIAGTGVCVLSLLLDFVCMCGRVRKETAFTPANVRALGRIAMAFAIAGVLLILSGEVLVALLTICLRGFFYDAGPTLWLWELLPAFAAWTAALMVRAIQVLMKRAAAMQTESDLTV